MSRTEDFTDAILTGYQSEGENILLGSALLDGEILKEARIRIPLKTLNRHGLISGATGTGKTVSLQILAENICAAGIPVLLMDLKGDLSGIAETGVMNAKLVERQKALGLEYIAAPTSAEFLSISNEPGVRLRATVSEFGPVLFSKILELNPTQSSIMSLLFKYADDKQLPLLDLKDAKQLLQFAAKEGKAEIQSEYGNISPASLSTILRKIIELESQGGEIFFGETSFDVNDLLRHDSKGRGIASIIRLRDIQDKPKLFSSFMLCLLAEVYSSFPEAGDTDKPRLCIFIDEAHLIFREASDALLHEIESIIKLIRSKGVGVFFITQNPYDVPDSVLSQLGLKVQHALRAFTEKDRKAIKKTAENYPVSAYYRTDELITSLGIGQALITALNEKGIPTPLAAVHLRAPVSRIGSLSEAELNEKISRSMLAAKYNAIVDRESAYEILRAKMNGIPNSAENARTQKPATEKGKKEKSILEQAGNSPVVKQIGRTVAREVTRGLLGILGLGPRRKSGWF
ncbi:MAG TPA: DUF853 family protein [Bacteroidia bacterium]|nr:DUF853 family protein [Bacteroidia bacterium]